MKRRAAHDFYRSLLVPEIRTRIALLDALRRVTTKVALTRSYQPVAIRIPGDVLQRPLSAPHEPLDTEFERAGCETRLERLREDPRMQDRDHCGGLARRPLLRAAAGLAGVALPAAWTM